jgi:hypothetical protein
MDSMRSPTNSPGHFGTARVGQSYLFKSGDQFYEARVTYFRQPQESRIHPDRNMASPKDIVEAMYRPVEAQRYSAASAAIRQLQTSTVNSMNRI